MNENENADQRTERLCIEEILEALITSNVDIGFREVVRRSEGLFRHPSNLTTVEWRRKLIEEAMLRQEKYRAHLRAGANASRADLEERIAKLECQVETLKSERTLLQMAIKAMYRTSLELGGIAAFNRFLQANPRFHDELKAAALLPVADVHPFPKRGK